MQTSLPQESSVKPKTVLVVAHAWNGDTIGGAFRIATELAIGLAKNGWRVVYLCCNPGGAADHEIIEGVDIRRYRIRQRRLAAPRFWQHIHLAQRLTRAIAAEHDIVAVSGHSPLQYLGTLKALAKDHAIRKTYVVHSPFAEEQLAALGTAPINLRVRAKVAIAAYIDHLCLRGSTAIHLLSKYTLECLIRRYGDWVRKLAAICPGWVDITRFQPSTERRQNRTALPHVWHTDAPIVFTLRRLERRMGLDTLIEAAALLPREISFRILIGGGGPEQLSLRETIKLRGLEDRVFLLGRIPDDDLPRCYAAADVFVLPTRSLECFGLIILEAFATDTPVIGTRVGAIPELLAETGEEWLFEAGDAPGLARRLTHFLQRRPQPAVDVRQIALRHNFQDILPQWIDICLGPQQQAEVLCTVEAE